MTNDQYQFGLTIPVIIQNEKIVMDSSSVLASEKIIDLRNGSIMLYVGTQFQQPDGDFLIGEEYPIEIVD